MSQKLVPQKLVGLIASSLIIGSGAAGLATLAIPAPVHAQRNIDEEANIRVYQNASPAVVSIRAGGGSGSGSIIDAKGLVLTNAHVVRGVNTVTVTLANKKRLQGIVIARSTRPDLALIRLQGVQGNLPTIPIISSSKVQVGQRAFAIGDPFGQFAGTLTTGIISRIDSDRRLLQTDAAINPGNSGGPLLNSRGELVGVNTAIYTPGEGNVGLGFAINSDTAREFIAAAQQGRIASNNISPTNAVVPNSGNLSLNGTITPFTLSPNDPRVADGSSYKKFQFVGRAGQRLTVNMTSSEVDAYLALIDPRGIKIAEDDDSAGNSNARISVILPVSGNYILFANSASPGEYGRFTLKAQLENNLNAALPNNNTAKGIILQRNGVLGVNSNVLPRDGSLFESFNFTGRAGDVVQIRLNSPDFSPYVVLFAPDRSVLKENDSMADGKNAAIVVELPATGTYRVVANARNKLGRGNFNLTVRGL
jgi:serine protease Do